MYLALGGMAVFSDELDLHVSLPGLLRDAGAKRIEFLEGALTVPTTQEEFDTPYARYIERMFAGDPS